MVSKTTEKHRALAPKRVKAAVVTVSDSKFDFLWSKARDLEETKDVSGGYIVDSLKKHGHEVAFYTIVPDHKGIIREMIDHIASTYAPDMIITTGGTGIAKRDVTVEALRSIMEKEAEGFGELFRRKSFEHMGEAALLTRALAGTYNGVLIVALPGSPDAAKTGMEIVLKEAGHLVKHVRE